MRIYDIIKKKRDNHALTKEEINFFVEKYSKGEIPDYQASALLMAIYLNKMNKEETAYLTEAMMNSGEVIDLSQIKGIKVDKHSTGGVGDKTTIALAPLVAACGAPVAKMSGRGLGHTGGTLDKLEAIPGFSIEMESDKFIDSVNTHKIAVCGQTASIAVADKKMYALRDTINCVGSMPLIASSIMSKKIAAGANKIVLDVTCGSGAFMKNKTDAEKLSNIMKGIGDLAGRETVCVITNMDEPVGYAIGNSLEIIETVECLKGNMPEDIKEIITTIGSYIIKLAGKGNNLEENKVKILENIKNGKAYNKFLELVQNQNGNIEYIRNTDKFEKTKYILPVISKEDGYVYKLNAERVGKISVNLGAGRIKKEDSIDKSVGIVLNKKISDKVKKGDILAFIYANDEEKGNQAVEDLQNVYEISKEPVKKEEIILGVI